jgi:hypothetical protein
VTAARDVAAVVVRTSAAASGARSRLLVARLPDEPPSEGHHVKLDHMYPIPERRRVDAAHELGKEEYPGCHGHSAVAGARRDDSYARAWVAFGVVKEVVRLGRPFLRTVKISL